VALHCFYLQLESKLQVLEDNYQEQAAMQAKLEAEKDLCAVKLKRAEELIGKSKLHLPEWPYHIENTGSRPITKVKQCRAWLVLGWLWLTVL
jgi:hypothetical protein